ncbi:microtubule-associated protein tau [Sabethes cyaneus]|uniref:microtubule-associated protein tau n=1 Tax=Sabethes cyaneus TaxID=53552 RepID=UPI00237DFC7E|nr:microtubule-associated protein tau [Sabethes cyaneus]
MKPSCREAFDIAVVRCKLKTTPLTPKVSFGEVKGGTPSIAPLQGSPVIRPPYAKPAAAPQIQDLPVRQPVGPAQQFIAFKPPQHPNYKPQVYYQPGTILTMNQNGAGSQRPPNPSMSPQNMRPIAPPMMRQGPPAGPRPTGSMGSTPPNMQYPSSPNVRPQMQSPLAAQPAMQRPQMPQNMRPLAPQLVRPPGVGPQNARPPVSPQNVITNNTQFIRQAAPQFRSPSPGQPSPQITNPNSQSVRPPPIQQQVASNRPPSASFKSPPQSNTPVDQYGFDSPENQSRPQVDHTGRMDSPKGSYLSTDDDEDVVIGKITPLSSSRSPEGQTSPTSKNPSSVPMYRSDSQASIPSRPPSALGNFSRSSDPRHSQPPSQMLQSNEIIYKEKLPASADKPLDGLSGVTRMKTPSPDENSAEYARLSNRLPSVDTSARSNRPLELGSTPSQEHATSGRSRPPISSTPSTERVTFVLPEETNDGTNSEPMRKTPVPPNVLKKPDAETRGRSPFKNHLTVGGSSSASDNKGDNDSGVDESTQEKERNGPGSPGSPLKSPSKIPSLRRPESITPQTRSRSTSKQRLTAKTPETPTEPLIKKVPMNKIQVGATPSPNLKVVKSKIGSLENATHKPGGGNIKIETKKIEIKAAPRIEAKNEAYVPKGGDKKILSTKLQWNARSKIGSLENANHKPGGGDKKIETLKTDFKDRAKSKVGSKDNLGYQPGGGDVKPGSAAVIEQRRRAIVNQKLDIKAESKVGSLENVKHKPGGGDIKIFDDKEYLKQIDHPIAPTPPTQRSVRKMASSMSGVELSRELGYSNGPGSLASLQRPSSLTASLSLPAECIVLSLAPGPTVDPSPERKLRRVESTRSFIRKDGRAIHPKPFRIY